jgi:hypothetical protein
MLTLRVTFPDGSQREIPARRRLTESLDEPGAPNPEWEPVPDPEWWFVNGRVGWRAEPRF